MIYDSCQFCGGEVGRYSRQARACWPCDRAASRVMWEAYLKMRKAQREGFLAPIKSQYCVDCGALADHYDHRDYFRPTDVVPVCRRCNQKRGAAATFLNEVQHFQVSV